MKRPITLAILFLIAFASMSYVPAARASDQIVTDAGDNGGADQLRAKIVAAQSSGGGTITFHIGPAIITLAGILPAITTVATMPLHFFRLTPAARLRSTI